MAGQDTEKFIATLRGGPRHRRRRQAPAAKPGRALANRRRPPPNNARTPPRAGGKSPGMSSHFSIAHVTPYPWEAENEVDAHVRAVAGELSRRGHRVLIVAPSRSQERVRDSRRALRAGRGRGEDLLEGTDTGTPAVIAVGEVLDVVGSARKRPSALPIDVARTVEELLGTVDLDFVHVHEPFAPSTSNAALRHSRSLNVGSFHSSSERLLSTLLARRFVESFYGRLDARTASLPETAALMDRHFPGEIQAGARRGRVGGRARGHLFLARRQAPRAPGRPGCLACAGATGADRRRPSHAHRPLVGLRDARGGAARHRARTGPRRDRRHGPQRDIGGARRPGARRAGGREGDRRRGGQDGRPG